MIDSRHTSFWQRFWHEPVRAERLAITRVFLGLAFLSDQLLQYLPEFPMLFGPESTAPLGIHDAWSLSVWRWPVLVFHTDDMTFLYTLFWVRFGIAVAFLVGFFTRLMNVLLWFLTNWFLIRNPALRTGADDVLMVGLFLLMFAPTGRAFAIDEWWRRRKLPENLRGQPGHTPAWPVRLLQIQLCCIYLVTGLAKLIRTGLFGEDFFNSTWWEGTSLHYVLSNVTFTRWSAAQLPLPIWLTGAATYVSVWWEVLFPLLVLWGRTRWLALWFGVLFHIGIFLTIEIGWFSFYTLSLYGVWIADSFWDRWRGNVPVPSPPAAHSGTAPTGL